MAAARKEFIAKGLDGARMQAIASGAGVNKALLHYYYRSKERLYRTVLQDTLESVWGNIQGELLSHSEEDGVEALLRILVSTYVRTLSANPDFPLFMFREMSSGGATFQAVVKDLGAPMGDIPGRLKGALAAEVKAGKISPVNPIHFFTNIMGMCVATFLARPLLEKLAPMLGGTADFGSRFMEERVRSIVDMAMNGIRSRRG